MKLFGFKPHHGECVGDAMPYYYNGMWHVFYLKPPPGAWDPVERSLTTMAHVVSKNLVDWQEMPDCFTIGEEGDPDEKGCWTGCVVKHNNLFHFFYTGYDPKTGRQNICKALSENLISWSKISDNPILEADDRHYEKGDWRDPFVYWDQDKSEYRMLVVARRNIGPYWNRGCIAQAISNDLDNWELLSPSESGFPKHQTFCPECPEIFPLGEYWYYVVSRFSEDQQTVYYVSQNPDGPWERRRLDTLEGRRFYAAKSATDGNRRISFAWIPFRQHSSDTGVFAWGGTFGSPRQLVSMKDGTLTMRLPQELDRMYERETSLNIMDHLWGHWDIGEDIITISANNEYTFGFLDIREREDVMVSAEITIANDGTLAGILLEPDKDMGSGYFLSIDPLKQQVTLNKWPQDQDFHWETWLKIGNPNLAFWQEKNNPIVTRPLAYLPQDDTYVVKVLRKESAVECYVADQVCASFRIYKKSDIPFGIFVQGGRAVFRNLCLRK